MAILLSASSRFSVILKSKICAGQSEKISWDLTSQDFDLFAINFVVAGWGQNLPRGNQNGTEDQVISCVSTSSIKS